MFICRKKYFSCKFKLIPYTISRTHKKVQLQENSSEAILSLWTRNAKFYCNEKHQKPQNTKVNVEAPNETSFSKQNVNAFNCCVCERVIFQKITIFMNF